jgi:hypothetical protein
MELLYKTAMVGQVWLTAVMTLLAATPQFTCICPNGSTKAPCVSLGMGSSGCCCQPLKAANADRSIRKSCCERHRDQKLDQRQGNRVQAGQKCCTKTLTPPQVTAVSYHKTVVERDVTLQALVLQSVTLSPSSLATANGPTLCQINLTAPPTDLVEQLQRYLI